MNALGSLSLHIAFEETPARLKKKDKPKKERANKYDEKLAVNASFAEVFKVIKKNKEEKKNKN